MVSHPFLGEVECSDESSFSEGGGPPAEPRGGGVPVCNQHQEEGKPSGGGPVMSHPFQEGGGGTVMSYPFLGEGTPCGLMGRGYDSGLALTQYWLDDSFPRRGGGTVMSSSMGACTKGGEGAPPITAKGRGWGAEDVNVWAKCLHFYSYCEQVSYNALASDEYR